MTKTTCGLCGEPMPEGEGMFKFHGYSGPCPKPPLEKSQDTLVNSPWDEWYSRLPADLKQRLAIHDFKRLGDLFAEVFDVS